MFAFYKELHEDVYLAVSPTFFNVFINNMMVAVAAAAAAKEGAKAVYKP